MNFLLIAFATRAAHNPSERLGQSREVHDRERFNGLLAGLFNHLPINTSMETCVNRNAQCFNDTVLGINRTTVPMSRETINTPTQPPKPTLNGKTGIRFTHRNVGKINMFVCCVETIDAVNCATNKSTIRMLFLYI